MHRTKTQGASQKRHTTGLTHRTCPVCTGPLKTEFALDAQFGRVRCHTGRVRYAPDENSESFSEKAFSPEETHRTPGGNCFQVRCLNSDTSDLIPDASGFTSDASVLTSDVSSLYALHETNSNFFPCFHVPTPKCHNTCASVLAFSQTFFQGS